MQSSPETPRTLFRAQRSLPSEDGGGSNATPATIGWPRHVVTHAQLHKVTCRGTVWCIPNSPRRRAVKAVGQRCGQRHQPSTIPSPGPRRLLPGKPFTALGLAHRLPLPLILNPLCEALTIPADCASHTWRAPGASCSQASHRQQPYAPCHPLRRCISTLLPARYGQFPIAGSHQPSRMLV